MIQDITLIDKIQMKDFQEECKQIEDEGNSGAGSTEENQTGKLACERITYRIITFGNLILGRSIKRIIK